MGKIFRISFYFFIQMNFFVGMTYGSYTKERTCIQWAKQEAQKNINSMSFLEPESAEYKTLDLNFQIIIRRVECLLIPLGHISNETFEETKKTVKFHESIKERALSLKSPTGVPQVSDFSFSLQDKKKETKSIDFLTCMARLCRMELAIKVQEKPNYSGSIIKSNISVNRLR